MEKVSIAPNISDMDVYLFFSNNSSDKLLIESALDNTEKIVANILANANQGKRQVVLKER